MRVGVMHNVEHEGRSLRDAVARGETYEVRAKGGWAHWIRGHWDLFAPFTVVNILRRVGVSCVRMTPEAFLEARPRRMDALVVTDADRLDARSRERLRSWARSGLRVVMIGRCEEWVADTAGGRLSDWFEWEGAEFTAGHASSRSPLGGGALPMRFQSHRFRVVTGALAETSGRLRPFSGQVRSRVPGFWQARNWIWCPVAFLEDASAVLQGALSPAPLFGRMGLDANFWLDRVAGFLGAMLVRARAKEGDGMACRKGRPGRAGSVFVLRHDTDYSVDDTYERLEMRAGVPATYALLMDRSVGQWRDRLAPVKGFEKALHFSLHPERTLGSRLWGLIGAGGRQKDLAGQIEEFQSAVGPMMTAHRHLGRFDYPEDIEQLHGVHRKVRGLIGTCSMFRFTDWRVFGRPLGTGGIEHPNTNISLWSPFRLVRATAEGLEFLKGWESGAFMELGEEGIDRLLHHSRAFHGGVYPIIYHPAHAASDRLRKGGMAAAFEYLLRRAGRMDAAFRTFGDVFLEANALGEQWN